MSLNSFYNALCFDFHCVLYNHPLVGAISAFMWMKMNINSLCNKSRLILVFFIGAGKPWWHYTVQCSIKSSVSTEIYLWSFIRVSIFLILYCCQQIHTQSFISLWQRLFLASASYCFIIGLFLKISFFYLNNEHPMSSPWWPH